MTSEDKTALDRLLRRLTTCHLNGAAPVLATLELALLMRVFQVDIDYLAPTEGQARQVRLG